MIVYFHLIKMILCDDNMGYRHKPPQQSRTSVAFTEIYPSWKIESVLVVQLYRYLHKAYWFRCCLARISGALGPLIIYPIHDSCHDRRQLRRIYPPAWCMREPVEGHHTGNILFQCVNEGSSWVQLVSMHKWPKSSVKTITSTTCMYPCHPESNGNGKKY